MHVFCLFRHFNGSASFKATSLQLLRLLSGFCLICFRPHMTASPLLS